MNPQVSKYVIASFLFTVLALVFLKNDVGGAQPANNMSLKTSMPCPACPPSKCPPLSSFASTPSSPAPATKNKSGFDEIHSRAYSKVKQRLMDMSGWTKHVFDKGTLESWERGDGGLEDSDRLLVAKYYYAANSVFEFGLGESTKIAAHINVPFYKGMDTDATWVGIARDNAPDHFRFEFGDIGTTIAWGNPATPFLPKAPIDYTIQPLSTELEPFDIYMVDGRYRVASALASFLHALSKGMARDEIRVFIHDYTERPHYHKIEQWTERVEVSRLLVVLKLKAGTTEDQLVEAWESFVTTDYS